MTNKQAIKLFKNRKKIKVQLKKAKAAWDRARKRMDETRKQYEVAREVTEIFEGKALYVGNDEIVNSVVFKGKAVYIGKIAVYAPWTERRAELYKSVRTKRTWGLRIYALTRVQTMEEIFCGSGWKRKQDALEDAKRFVAFGKMPKMEGENK
jgi:ubiquitin